MQEEVELESKFLGLVGPCDTDHSLETVLTVPKESEYLCLGFDQPLAWKALAIPSDCSCLVNYRSQWLLASDQVSTMQHLYLHWWAVAEIRVISVRGKSWDASICGYHPRPIPSPLM